MGKEFIEGKDENGNVVVIYKNTTFYQDLKKEKRESLENRIKQLETKFNLLIIEHSNHLTWCGKIFEKIEKLTKDTLKTEKDVIRMIDSISKDIKKMLE